MKPEPITELKDILMGSDVYVIASGPSAGYIEPSFFDNKWCLGVNNVWMRFNVDYVVRKEFTPGGGKSAPPGTPVIIAKHRCGNLGLNENQYDDGIWYVFEHEENNLTNPDLDVIGTDKIVVSFSTITSAMHIAAYMGAGNIILVGHDCGWLDGETNIPDYTSPLQGELGYIQFLQTIEPQSIAVRDRLKEIYGVNVYSLNPFLNFGLEGHKYERHRYRTL